MTESASTAPIQQKTTKCLWARWLDDISRLLPIRSQFVISGNVRDVFLVPHGQGFMLAPIVDALLERLRLRGFEMLVSYDRTDGYAVQPETQQVKALAESLLGEKPADRGAKKISKQCFVEIARAAATAKRTRLACVVDYASRLAPSGENLAEADYEFFAACEKTANVAVPVYIQGQQGLPLFNPLFWIANRMNDLPSWLTLDNELVGAIVIPLPDYETRRNAALLLGPQFVGYDKADGTAKDTFAKEFANHTEGMTLRSMMSVAQLAMESTISFNNIDDAVRSYKIGFVDSPWKQSYLREKVQNAPIEIGKKIKGQDRAIGMAVNILVRSIMGMTGAQAPSTSGRPRGVMFFAGPTGVGKTELAKALTNVLFNDDRAYIRFDMSLLQKSKIAANTQ